jgi:hypothetical protein
MSNVHAGKPFHYTECIVAYNEACICADIGARDPRNTFPENRETFEKVFGPLPPDHEIQANYSAWMARFGQTPQRYRLT